MDSDDWYTPADFVAVVRAFFGGKIDLDPASSKSANEVVRASRYYTRADDGTRRAWRGRVFVNPPFSRGMRARFLDATLRAREGGAEIVWLSDHDHSTAWCQKLLREADAYCLPEGRLIYWRPGGGRRSGERPHIIGYFGCRPNEFHRSFGSLGPVTLRRNAPCEACGQAFEARRADALYCSSACRQRAYRRRAQGTP